MSKVAGRVSVCIEALPRWLEIERFLGFVPLVREPTDADHVRVELSLLPREAAELAARLRGLGIDGRTLEIGIRPPLARALVREARLFDARARRETTKGFVHPQASASGEGRFSLTPEALALALGAQAAGRSVVDACCGSGGNTLGFARAGSQVTAIELDRERLAEARHNAAVYGVAERIRFVHGDALTQLAQERADILFVDPPWGESYDKKRTVRGDFPLLDALLARPLAHYGELWLKLPSSFEVASIPGSEPSAWFGAAPGDQRRIKFVLLRRKLAAQ